MAASELIQVSFPLGDFKVKTLPPNIDGNADARSSQPAPVRSLRQTRQDGTQASLLGVCEPRLTPAFTETGHLPAGIHEVSLEMLKEYVVTNRMRAKMWNQLLKFLHWVVTTGEFSHLYFGGGFVSTSKYPRDIDLVLHVRHSFGDRAFRAMEPFFAHGLDAILESYSVHLHFWVDGFPGIMDFRSFFQYVTPDDSRARLVGDRGRKGLLRIDLTGINASSLPAHLEKASAMSLRHR